VPNAQEVAQELEQLRTAMKTRPTIDQAKGALMASYAFTPMEAWQTLVCVSQNTNIKLKMVARQITRSTYHRPAEPSVRTALAASVRMTKAARLQVI
jgi:AmiR/NasT family two-component response regulator